ncbi:hypothetical protein D3C86_2036640 [compost metagenome]
MERHQLADQFGIGGILCGGGGKGKKPDDGRENQWSQKACYSEISIGTPPHLDQ